MVKQVIILLLFSLFVIACTESENIQYKKHISSLEIANDSLVALTKQCEVEMAKVQSHNANLESLYIPIQDLEICAQETSKWVLDKVYLIQFVIDRYKLASNVILGQLEVEYLNDNGLYGLDNFNKLLRCINRSPETIKHFFSDKDKERIYSLFEGNTIYQSSGLSAIAEGLLFTYEDLKDDPDFLDAFGEVAYGTASNKERDTYYDIATSNQKLNEILSDERYWDPTDQSYLTNRTWYVYTFWMRRHREGNSEVVYELIKEIHDNLKLRPDLDFENDEHSL